MKILYTLLVLSISLFFSQVSANYGGCNTTGPDVQKYYKNNGSCTAALFGCTNNIYTWGVQFSPAPPQPISGTSIFTDALTCNQSGDININLSKQSIPSDGGFIHITVSGGGLTKNNTQGCSAVIAHPNKPNAVNANLCNDSSNYRTLGTNGWSYTNGSWKYTLKSTPKTFPTGTKFKVYVRNTSTGKQQASKTVYITGSSTSSSSSSTLNSSSTVSKPSSDGYYGGTCSFSSTKNMYYQHATSCVYAYMDCRNGRIERSTQFSPSPPKPNGSIALYETNNACTQNIVGDNRSKYFSQATSSSNGNNTTNSGNNNTNTSKDNLIGKLNSHLDVNFSIDNPFAANIGDKYKPKLLRIMQAIEQKRSDLSPEEYQKLIQKIAIILQKNIETYPNSSHLQNIAGYIGYELGLDINVNIGDTIINDLLKKVDSNISTQNQSCGNIPSNVGIVKDLDWGNPAKLAKHAGYINMNNTKILSMPFTATNNPEYRGYVSSAAAVGSSDVLRRVWFSYCAGGPEISESCIGGGTSTSTTRWQQKTEGKKCYLAPGQKYHINFQNIAPENNPDRCKLNTSCDIHIAFRKSNNPYISNSQKAPDKPKVISYGICTTGGSRYYKTNNTCTQANFYCSENKLLRGSQFSPSPTKPITSSKLYTNSGCK